jgi:hypothetical protein
MGVVISSVMEMIKKNRPISSWRLLSPSNLAVSPGGQPQSAAAHSWSVIYDDVYSR